MQIACFHCRNLMTIPDQAAHLGGAFTCPFCHTVNSIAPMAVPAAAYRPATSSTAPTAQDSRTKTAFGLAVGGGVLTLFAPKIGIIGGGIVTLWGAIAAVQKKTSILRLVYPESSHTRLLGIGSAVIGLAFMTCGTQRLIEANASEEALAEQARLNRAATEERREAAETARIEEAEKASAREAELRAGASDTAQLVGAALDDAEAAVAGERWQDVKEAVARSESIVSKYDELDPVPPEIARVMSRKKDLQESLSRKLAIVDSAATMAAAKQALSEAVDAEAWEVAESSAKLGLEQVDTLENAPEDLKMLVPKTLNLKSERSAFEKMLKKSSKKADKIRAQRAAAEAYAALCGERPTRSEWDGEFIEIESAMRRVAHDPDSIDVENCTHAVMTDDNCWVTRCEVRGRNGFGALVLDTKRFSMSSIGIQEI